MTAYFDTSVVTKWYLPEPDSAAAPRALGLLRPRFSLTCTELSWSRPGTSRSFHVAAGLWQLPDYDPVDVYSRAESLSRRYTSIFGARSLDILHVAAAVVLDASAFVTHDDRQARLAKAAGLPVITLRARATRR